MLNLNCYASLNLDNYKLSEKNKDVIRDSVRNALNSNILSKLLKKYYMFNQNYHWLLITHDQSL